MAEVLIYDDAEKSVYQSTSAGWPDVAGSTRSLRTVWKAGTPQAILQAIQDRLDAAVPLNTAFQGQSAPAFTSIATAQAAFNIMWADMQKMSQAIVGLIYLARGRNDTTSGT